MRPLNKADIQDEERELERLDSLRGKIRNRMHSLTPISHRWDLKRPPCLA